MPFLVTIEVHDLEHVFSNPAVSASARGKASVLLTLIPLLIQMLMLFLLSPSLLVGGLAASDRRGVGRYWCQRRRGFFDGVVAGVSGRGGL